MNRKYQIGSDKGKTPTGVSDKGDNPENSSGDDTQKRVDVVTFSEILDLLVADLMSEGFYLYPSMTGDFCCWDVYKEYPLEVDGLEIPRGFHYLKPVKAKDAIARNNFSATLKSIVTDRRRSCKESEAFVWGRIFTSFEDDLNNPNNQVSRIALSRLGNDHRKVTFNGASRCHKVVPKTEWFPEKVRNLNARSLLTLFPDPEARQFMLILGRAMAGASKTETAEGFLVHTSRSYGVIVGNEAGMGKSTLLTDYLMPAMKKLGYRVEITPVNDTRFGWGDIATSDLAVLDDLTEGDQKRLLKDVKIKTIASNGYLKVEEKGLRATTVRATTTLLWNTNCYKQEHYIGMDEGSISRVNQLYTYSRYELAKRYPEIEDARFSYYWDAKAQELGTSIEVLAMWLLRNSLDHFLTTCGYHIEDGVLVQVSKSQLEETTNANRAEFRLGTSLKNLEELTTSAAHLVALAIAYDTHSRETLLGALKDLQYSPDILLAQLKVFSQQNKLLNLPELELIKLKLVNANTKKYLPSAKLNDFGSQNITVTQTKAFENLTRELTGTNGFKYPTTLPSYQYQWEIIRDRIPELVKHYQVVLDNKPNGWTIESGLVVPLNEIQVCIRTIGEMN